MKKTIIIASIILLSTNLSAQIKNITVVENASGKILYQCIENKLNVLVESYKTNDIRLEISSGKIEHRNNSFYVTPGKTSDVEIRIIADGYLIKKEKYKTVKIPDPYIIIANKKEGLLEKKELLKAGEIEIKFENPYFDTLFSIKEFFLSAEINGMPETAKSNGNKLSEAQIQLIRRMPAGEITFKDIKLENKGNFKKEHTVQSLSKFKINGAELVMEVASTGKTGNFKLSEIINNKAKLIIKNPSKQNDFVIQSFELQYTENDVIKKYRSYSSDFTPEMTNAIKNSKTNYFEIKKISIKSNLNGESEYTDDISFYISERN